MAKDVMIEILKKQFRFSDFDENDINVAKILSIKEAKIDLDLEKIPFYLELFGRMQARALREFKMRETRYKIWRANKGRLLKDKKVDGKALTEKQREDLIVSDPEYLVYKTRLHKAEEEYEILKSVYWAISKKSEILIMQSQQRAKVKKVKNL